MKRILVPIGCRSDEGLSAPVIKRLREHFITLPVDLAPQDFLTSYQLIDAICKADPPDLILITGDRVEMCAAAAAAFHNKVKIAHFYAGVVNDPITTFDDVDRHVISLWADILFVESEDCKFHLAGFDGGYDMHPTGLFSVGCPGFFSLKGDNIHVVGISHLEDLEIDECKVPGEPYNLILRNKPPLGDTTRELKDILMVLMEHQLKRKNILIGGNPDGVIGVPEGFVYYPNLPRSQFLGLLKNCQRFITNSSAAIYEAPHFLKPEQIVMVGDRNKNRPKGPFQTGASDRIVEILREYLK